MVSIQERFLFNSGLWWLAYGTLRKQVFFLFFFNFDGFLKLSPGHHPCGCGYILHLLPLTLRWHTWRSVVVVTEGHGRGFAVWRLPVNSSIHTHYVLGLGKWSRVRLRMNIHFVWLPQRGSEAVENWRRRPASLRDYPLLLPSDVRCLLLAWVSALLSAPWWSLELIYWSARGKAYKVWPIVRNIVLCLFRF